MKKKWWIIALATIAACIGLAFVIPALRPWRPGVTKENFDRIEIGMTRAEIEAILGPPTDFDPPFVWLDLPGIEPGAGEPIWENDRGDEVRIQFDESSRAKTKHWDEWPDERGVFEKVMDQLPWRERPVVRRPRWIIL